MQRKGSMPLPPGFMKVRERFDRWRDTRAPRSQIPEQLWRAAAKLCRDTSINKISMALHLNHTALKEWVEAAVNNTPSGKEPRPTFVEVHQPPAPAECVVEMENARGAKLRVSIRGRGDIDLVALGNAFWSHGS